MKRAGLLILVCVFGCEEAFSVNLTDNVKTSIAQLCAKVSTCIDTLSEADCVSETSGEFRVSDDACAAALAAHATCVDGMNCTDVDNDDYTQCQTQFDAFNANCLDTAATCSEPCGDCPGSQACVLLPESNSTVFSCAVKHSSTGSEGDLCANDLPGGAGCDYGTVCTPAEQLSNCGRGDSGEHCCASYCCPGVDSCPGDDVCRAIGDSIAGLCQKPNE